MHSLPKLWLQRWLVGLWQCVHCGSAIVLKNVRWAKNIKHRVGLSVGFLGLSIFRFSVLSQWFTFQFMSFVVCLLHLAVTVGTCCRGGFRRAFLSEGHGTAMRESAVGVPPNPPCNMYFVMRCHFFILSNYIYFSSINPF